MRGMSTHPGTPPLRPDADPDRSAEYARRLAEATTLSGMNRVHKEFADLCQNRTLGQEIGNMIRAPKGSVNAKVRDRLGIFLILFGLFGVAILFWILLAIGSLIL